MTERWADIAGRIEGGHHVLPVRVYYEDTDFSGAVYHANYLKFCERARSDCLRLSGIHHAAMKDTAGFVVRRMVCEFLRPAQIDDLLEIETGFVEAAGARMEILQAIRRGPDLLFKAQVTVALVDRNGKPKRLPADMAAAFGALRK